MFRRLEAAAQAATDAPVRITVDDQPVHCRAGDSVAAALFVAGLTACRETAVSETPRGPYCMMGVCYDCLVNIDGMANQQACMTQVRAGMAVCRQHGAREVKV